MYNKEALKRMISKNGLATTIAYLSSPDFPEAIKDELAKDDIFVGGKPNTKLIAALV